MSISTVRELLASRTGRSDSGAAPSGSGNGRSFSRFFGRTGRDSSLLPVSSVSVTGSGDGHIIGQ